ncbi:MAG: DUF924 family protein [Burkholderiales bacterium]
MQEFEFSLDGEFIELNNLLKLAGVCDSGGACKQLVASGAVSVDGRLELRKRCKIRAGQEVSLGDVRIRVAAAAGSGATDIDGVTPDSILEFWYSAPLQKAWFSSTPELDSLIRDRYRGLWRRACEGGLDGWKASPEACLALIVVLDQFPLNMFRGQAMSFETEDKAIALTKYALEQGYQHSLAKERLVFLYLPLMHSENLDDQDLAVRLFEEAGLEDNVRFAKHHREIVRKFGRFPHRNAILGRKSSPAEIEYLGSEEAFLG